MKPLQPFCRICLPLLLVALTGCANVRDALDAGKSGLMSMLPEKSSDTVPAHGDITSRLHRVDQAYDNTLARNTLTHELIDGADQTCKQTFVDLTAQIKHWKMPSSRHDKLDEMLTIGIAQRNLDRSNPELSLVQPADATNAKQQLTDAIITTINKQRGAIRLALTAREKMDISRYPIKQALRDVQAYHRACTLSSGLAGVAHNTSQRMTAEEKHEQIESLMQLRQTLMQQGLNTRAIQQKIDTIILTD